MRIADSIRAFTRNQNKRDLTERGQSIDDQESERAYQSAFIFAWVDMHTANDPESHFLAFQSSFSLSPSLSLSSYLVPVGSSATRHTNTRARREYPQLHAPHLPYLLISLELRRRSPTLNPGSSSFPSVPHYPLASLIFYGRIFLMTARNSKKMCDSNQRGQLTAHSAY